MRGLVTLATAFALPAGCPQRDLIVLATFAVVMATLVVQGLTLGPLVCRLGPDSAAGVADEVALGRAALADAALTTLDGRTDPAAGHWRHSFEAARAAAGTGGDPTRQRAVGLFALRTQRERLEALRASRDAGPEAFLILQEEARLQDSDSRTCHFGRPAEVLLAPACEAHDAGP